MLPRGHDLGVLGMALTATPGAPLGPHQCTGGVWSGAVLGVVVAATMKRCIPGTTPLISRANQLPPIRRALRCQTGQTRNSFTSTSSARPGSASRRCWRCWPSGTSPPAEGSHSSTRTVTSSSECSPLSRKSARTESESYLNAPDPSQPFGYNPLRRVREDKIPLAASGVLETLRKLWPDAWGVRMEHVLRNSLYALLERDGSRLPDILRLYVDEKYRKQLAAGIRNDTVRQFWTAEFEHYPPRLKAEAVVPIQNKLGALLSDPTLHRILVAPAIDLSFRRIMDEGRVLLVNLARGRLGEDSAHVLGGLIVSTLGLAAFSRADEETAAARRPFFLYVDEFPELYHALVRQHALGITQVRAWANARAPAFAPA